MNVRPIDNERPSAHAANRPHPLRPAGTATGRADARGSNAPSPAASRGGDDDAGDITAARFDANDDGVVENWSYAEGGDSFSNFDPPPSGSIGSESTNPRKLDAAPRAETGPGRAVDGGTGPPTTPAAWHHARTAYRRDGTTNADHAPPASATGAQHAPTDGPGGSGGPSP